MKLKRSIFALTIAGFVTSQSPAWSASLQIAPVSVSVTYPAQAAKIDLANLGQEKIETQVRVYKWTQSGGEDILEPALDVAVSPPQASISAGEQQVVRIVQTGKPATEIEASYRLAIDELPTRNTKPDGASNVSFIVRYSVPAFFASDKAMPRVMWDLKHENGQLAVHAKNDGSRHIRISRLAVTIAGTRIPFGEGLNGYVLSRSEKVWRTPYSLARTSGMAHIQADSDVGTINTDVQLPAGK